MERSVPTFNFNNYVASKQALQDSGIDYRIKMQDSTTRLTGSALHSTGRASTNYRICVKKTDMDAAKRIFGRS